MPKIKSLSVIVTYRVGLGNLNASKEVIDQLKKACERGKRINPSDNDLFFKAGEWLTNEIKERDSFDWEVEIDEVD